MAGVAANYGDQVTFYGGQASEKPCSGTLGGLRIRRNQAVSALGRLTVASHAKALNYYPAWNK